MVCILPISIFLYTILVGNHHDLNMSPPTERNYFQNIVLQKWAVKHEYIDKHIHLLMLSLLLHKKAT
jgi:hypothetical protein